MAEGTVVPAIAKGYPSTKPLTRNDRDALQKSGVQLALVKVLHSESLSAVETSPGSDADMASDSDSTPSEWECVFCGGSLDNSPWATEDTCKLCFGDDEEHYPFKVVEAWRERLSSR